jgi:peptidoglycan/xylan/chitin deacetylase (PgdA/CDA1 family)
VVARQSSNALHIRRQVAGSWTSWESLGGTHIDAAAVTAVPSGGLDVVTRGANNALYSRRLRNGVWSTAWARAWVPAPPPVPAPSLLGTDWVRIPTTQPVVALTFDAGANANALPSILATLRSRNVPATFFLTGEFVRDFPAAANQVAVAGFPIGNHSDTHPDLRTLTDAQVQAELQTAETSILRANGVETRPLFRFPFGGVDSRVMGLVNGMGYVAVRWTVDTLGWQGTSGGRSAQSVLDRVLAGLQPGEIVLMHVGSHPTDGSTLDADALPRIVDEIRARGYRFVTLDTLIGR